MAERFSSVFLFRHFCRHKRKTKRVVKVLPNPPASEGQPDAAVFQLPDDTVGNGCRPGETPLAKQAWESNSPVAYSANANGCDTHSPNILTERRRREERLASATHHSEQEVIARMAIARTIRFKWEGQEIALGVDEGGSGSSVVLLTSLSSISTRTEMRPLFDRLAPDFRVVTVDWPGFGDLARPKIDYSPDALSAFLAWFLSEVVHPPHTVVAAGHAASYALYYAAYRPGSIKRLVLIAPTWRGPFPTMMGAYRPWFTWLPAAVDMPGLGPLLYRLNVSRFVVDKMVRGHVYTDSRWLSAERLSAKLAVTRAPGARHASVRFVAGQLDRVHTREAFLGLARQSNLPILLVYGDQTPPKSGAEMEALAALPNVHVERLPEGKLSVHEEFPDHVSSAIKSFLTE